ncbi:MAG: hypothetical protein J6N72_06835 [Psychrobacter sp.]|nr:hypothetical protein [Psychrobacter sp.]
MNTQTLQRVKIESAQDIVYGGGLPVSLKETGISKISIGSDIFKDGQRNTIIAVSMEPVIVFAAGYEMTGRYLFEAEDVDFNSPDDLINYIKNGAFNLSIEYDNDNDMPYNNWTIKAHNEEVLREIEQVSQDYLPVEEHLYNVGDRFSFDYDESCKDIAYDLERGLQLHQIPYSKTGLTKEFVQDFHAQLRQDIREFLLASGKK